MNGRCGMSTRALHNILDMILSVRPPALGFAGRVLTQLVSWALVPYRYPQMRPIMADIHIHNPSFQNEIYVIYICTIHTQLAYRVPGMPSFTTFFMRAILEAEAISLPAIA